MKPSNSRDLIKSFVERIERVNEEIKDLNGDKRDIFAEAKSQGFDTKALKIVIQRRAKDPDELSELNALVETYENALGTPVATRARATPQNLAGGEEVTQRTVNAPTAGSNPARSASEPDLTLPDFLDRSRETVPA